MTALARRKLFASAGALVVAFSLPGLAETANALPVSLKSAPTLSAWVRLDADGAITIFTGKAELGQGIRTAFIQIAADQLDVAPAAITLVTADTARTANEGYTSGSHSMQDSGTAILNATAEMRAILLGEAAGRLGVPATSLATTGGRVVAPDGRNLGYGELAAGIAPERQATPGVWEKKPDRRRVMGRSLPRVDIPAKMTGGAAYLQDLKLPGMVHARVIRPPSYGAPLLEVDSTATEALPGVIKIVRDGSYLAVIATSEWQAIVAMRSLAGAAKWGPGRTLPDPATIFETIRGLPARPMVIRDDRADIPTGARSLRAKYLRPYGMHASIGPSCAVGLMEGDAMTVWTHTQGVFPDRAAIAALLKMPPAKIRCIHMEGSGCYGHNGADDAAADAALLARAMPGKPIRVQWMRENENLWEPYTPAMVTEASASLDASGRIVDWQFGVWSNTHSTRPGGAGELIAGWSLAEPSTPAAPTPIPQPEGGGDRNAIPLYDVPNMKVTSHFIADMPLRVSAMRGLGAYMNVFSIESFIDELALAADADPVAFRLAHLKDSRARDVIALAAETFGWAAAASLPKDHGRGFAFARYKNLAAYAAVAVEVAVDRESGQVRVLRADLAVDSGAAVNPDGIRNQMQGGFIQASSWTLFEELRWSQTAITSRDWSSYPILRFEDVPARVDVHIIDRPDQPFLGTGEAAAGPTAAAIANAVAHATRARIRQLPLSQARVKAALTA